MDDYYVVGLRVEPRKLAIPRARSVARFAKTATNPHVELLHCYGSRDDGAEAIALAISATVPQRPAHDIRLREPILITFRKEDDRHPWVESLRRDFPRTPHTNLTRSGEPRSLCLYFQPWEDVKLNLTAPKLIARVMWWLEGTASGTLHGQDQPLEPLLFDPYLDLIVPGDILVDSDPGGSVSLNCYSTGRSLILRSADTTAKSTELPHGGSCLALVVTCQPQQHGVVRATPSTLAELHDFLIQAGVDLMGLLKDRLNDCKNGSDVEGASLILLVRLPKLRVAGGEVENEELRAFAVVATIGAVLREVAEGSDDSVNGASQDTGDEIQLLPLNPRPGFSRALAAEVNGEESGDSSKVLAVGVGALGSQVVSNLVRGGFGQWTLVDHDLLQPHNLGRHALGGWAVGVPKAHGMAQMLNGIVEGPPIAYGIATDALLCQSPGDPAIVDWKSYSVILDMSASVAVARHLCHDIESPARRVSLFLNPSGTALTLIAEDRSRSVPLDYMEMQHYRTLITNAELNGLLSPPSTMRSGVGCRDVSAQIPQDLLGLLAGIGSRAVRRAVEPDEAHIATWRVDESEYSVTNIAIHVPEVRRRKKNGWRIFWDAQLESKLRAARNEKLPSETGGVLIGSFDMARRIIYVVDATEAPPDSEEYPNGFLRGLEGLREEVDAIQEATCGMLGYIGEWHSHPTKNVAPSSLDLDVVKWVRRTLDDEGEVGVIGIVGSKQRLNFIPCGTALHQ